ncbi:TIGR03985 family CRISPR-associated protein [Nodosilinea sp. PGN35]|uniref:TIGR03985 family CRISPR-associated protein n=1 Tax=Nodosilinea sp. PGN35 TaxID=3020489 RepID=UPI00398A9BF6
MAVDQFPYGPTPQVLHWLSEGQLSSRLMRSVRCWVWLRQLYGGNLANLHQPFTYGDVRDRSFAPSHPKAEATSPEHISRHCQGTSCLCQQSTLELLWPNQGGHLGAWVAAVAALSGLATDSIEQSLATYPFDMVHRTLRDDLKHLVALGWLTSVGRGKFQKQPPTAWPQPLKAIGSAQNNDALSTHEVKSLLQVLEPIAFLQPQLAVTIDTLWRQVASQGQSKALTSPEPQRVFIHLDYIWPEEVQEQVDQHQADIEALWQSPDGGVVQFDNWSARRQQLDSVTVYPVCIHYARRAKYLSAYGQTPDGTLGWHNYRLDRVRSPRLRVLPWGDPQVPTRLKYLRDTGQLPTPEQVQAQLDAAWGFNFYLPRALLILRFPPEFARWYVDDTVRHPTFAAVDYADLAALVQTQVAEAPERVAILQVLAQRPPADAYYWGWMRVGDVNVTMRLRDWRPMGEVIAPLVVRQQMMAEAKEELERYGVVGSED